MSEDKRICGECMKEPYLRTVVSSSGTIGECAYCNSHGQTLDFEALADRSEQVLDIYFEPTSNSDAVVIYGRAPMGDSLKDVLEALLGADEEVLNDLADALTDRWFDFDGHEHQYGDDPHFVERSKLISSFSADWRRMEDSLRTEARLLNPMVSAILEKIFGPLLNYRTASGDGVIVDAGRGTTLQRLYRARVFQSLEDLEAALSHPSRSVGSPPPSIARAGRMNARGVSVFYGATISEIAVSEVRPPVGSRVLVGTFDITRPLRLLDLDKLADLVPHPSVSPFDPATKEVVERNQFLGALSSHMVMPVMPEHEDNGYLITQAIADYLATHPTLKLDGILFRSVQFQGPGAKEGRNVVLFNKASRVASSREEECATSHVQLTEADEDGEHWAPEIHVLHADDRPKVPQWFANADERDTALEIIFDELEIHEVKGVTFSTCNTKVIEYSDAKRPSQSASGSPFARKRAKWLR